MGRKWPALHKLRYKTVTAILATPRIIVKRRPPSILQKAERRLRGCRGKTALWESIAGNRKIATPELNFEPNTCQFQWQISVLPRPSAQCRHGPKTKAGIVLATDPPISSTRDHLRTLGQAVTGGSGFEQPRGKCCNVHWSSCARHPAAWSRPCPLQHAHAVADAIRLTMQAILVHTHARMARNGRHKP